MKTLFLTALITISLVGFANAAPDEIVHYREKVETPANINELKPVMFLTVDPDVLPDLELADIALDQIINIGKKVWDIIEAGKPVLNVRYSYANALPTGVSSGMQLSGFSSLEYASFRRFGKNGFGSTPYDLTYTVMHRYGGGFEGRGKYLDAVAVVPHEVSVLWGYNVDLGVQNVNVANVGSSEDPIASLVMELQLDVSTVLKRYQVRDVYELRGDEAKALAKNTTLQVIQLK